MGASRYCKYLIFVFQKYYINWGVKLSQNSDQSNREIIETHVVFFREFNAHHVENLIRTSPNLLGLQNR